MAEKVKLKLPLLKFTQVNPVLGYTHTLIDAFQVLWMHESTTCSRFVTCKKTEGLKFSNTENKTNVPSITESSFLNFKEIEEIVKKFQQNARQSDIRFADIYDLKGVPYYVAGVWVFECEYGKCRFQEDSSLGDFDPFDEDTSSIKKRKFKLSEDKPNHGCPAQVKFIEIIAFTEFDMKNQFFSQNAIKQRIIELIRSKGINAGEYRIYVSLPDSSAHSSHFSQDVLLPELLVNTNKKCITDMDTKTDHVYAPLSKMFRKKFDDLTGYVNTISDAMAIVKKVEMLTTMKYITLKATKNFGQIDVNEARHRIRRTDPRNPVGTTFNLENELHCVLGFMYLGCQHGKGKCKAQNSSAADVSCRESKKYDCPGAIAIKEIMVFPSYKFQKTNYKNKLLSSNLKMEIANGTSNGERRFYIALSPIEAHTCQNLGLKFKWKSLLENIENIVNIDDTVSSPPSVEEALPIAKDKLINFIGKLHKLANVMTSVELVNMLQVDIHSALNEVVTNMQDQYQRECTYKCHLCEKVFPQRYLLVNHMVTHTREKNYVCRICGKKFMHQGTMHRHKAAAHSAFRPHQCHICGLVYARTDNLRLHMRNKHNKEMPKITPKHASLMNEPYRLPHSASAKLPKLTGPFQCSICNVEYVKRRNLEIHMQRYHGLELASLVIESDEEINSEESQHAMEILELNENEVQLTQTEDIKHLVKNLSQEFITEEAFKKSIHYMCDICHQLFDSVYKLDDHFVEAHNSETIKIENEDETTTVISVLMDHQYTNAPSEVSQYEEVQMTDV